MTHEEAEKIVYAFINCMAACAPYTQANLANRLG